MSTSQKDSKNAHGNVIFNLPNTISWLRILSTIPIVLLMYLDNYIWAFLLFLLAALSDYIDGYFARKLGQVTKLGKVLDQMSDKILITSIFVVFVEVGMLPGWLVVILVFRDTLVSMVRMIASEAGNIIAANIFGKMKTVSQMILAISLFLEKLSFFQLERLLDKANTILIYFVAFVTVISGVLYTYQNREYLNR
ncbi:CDP-diacylglycerol--glycerol-3-phosphate 3-phosphatidyltransferase [Fervidobacterium changbaicum]|uniref:CDP-diacylglycerol--glycerol-3-phosphate 3-phosphatidyltransferase n=1 Tax=Fervidobacterium islandicum TaxID=2423 RepID=A0AAI8CNE5_FERIS|nr:MULTISPECIES: CDP-diacylglycerol--glycerol-3-phosphate 3-phosphatidyltransferase [Fervidobacterium]AMW33778.2 CDP-diacylglycerol--glycerol-3-phosphate 3-phosphatidyltransferase [Fervidobacterium islandicum]SDH06971.1 CDP-diacylglycerol--glycerol-3-phosphate 3-phosphatidyltransferase [Fervidobacterium changbaicum]